MVFYGFVSENPLYTGTPGNFKNTQTTSFQRAFNSLSTGASERGKLGAMERKGLRRDREKRTRIKFESCASPGLVVFLGFDIGLFGDLGERTESVLFDRCGSCIRVAYGGF